MRTLTRRTVVKLMSLGPRLIPTLSSLANAGAVKALDAIAPLNRKGNAFRLPFRHIHLDFHTSPAITGVGEDFKGADFAQVLKDAAVNSITVFAKCHHGMSYYATKVGIGHPHLKTDLLGEMIEGCHKAGILTVAYISTMYDQHVWRHHSDWRVLDDQGNEVGLFENAGPLKAELGRVCINTPQLDYLAAQAEEVVKNYDVDGIFFDNMLYPYNTGCSCQWCMLDRQKLGLDSARREDRVKHSQIVMERAMQRLAPIVRTNKPKARIFFNGPIVFERLPYIRKELKYFTHIEMESLPGGSWGYGYFEAASRYLRNLGLETMGQTGSFHRSWGDFGSVRNQAALDYECFRMLAQGCECAVGDHLHPRGQLNRAVYERIGRTYRSVAEKEPWCTGADAVTEIGFLTTVIQGAGGQGATGSDAGTTNMLEQLHYQFDVLDSESALGAYKLILLPDAHRLDGVLLEKIQAFLARGGKLILSNESGLDAAGTAFALPEMGLEYDGPWRHEVQYTEVLDKALNEGLPEMVHVFYEKGLAVRARSGTNLLARIWRPYFDRDFRHFQVEQTPFSDPTDYVAVAQRGNIVYIAVPIFRAYADFGYQFYRQLVGNCIARLLPAPLIKSDAPSTAQITVTKQNGRRIVHILSYVPERRAPGLDVVEDVIPLVDLKLALRVEQRPRRVYLAPQRQSVQFDCRNGYAHVVLPRVNGHQMIAFET